MAWVAWVVWVVWVVWVSKQVPGGAPTARSVPAVRAGTLVRFTRCGVALVRWHVVPGDTLYLLAKLLSHRPRRFISAAQGIVNGNLVFEAKITGMVM